MCASAGKRKSRNLRASFLAAPTPIMRGSSQKTLILINFTTKIMAKNARSNLFLKNFSEKKTLINKMRLNMRL
jgi:hypothetical protein